MKVIFLLVLVVSGPSWVKSDALDYRSVSYEDLLPSLEQFFDDGVGHFEQLLFDLPHHQLIVGARDALYRLSLEGLTRLEKAEWPAKQDKIISCTTKGQSEADCRNFIKILTSYRDQLLACGTYAFSPKCSWRPIEAINQVTKWVDGRGKCPYSPKANSSAFMNSKGDFIIASPTDFSSNDFAIYKMSGWPDLNQNLLRTVQYNSLWLSQSANFVLTFETQNYVYFVFRESSVEVQTCGGNEEKIYARIARVCKNDQGGQHFLKDNWTTFLKARLNCSQGGNYPFYYNEIQSATWLESKKMVYATFTTPQNSIGGSAICSFKLDDIQDTFDGSFMTRKGPDSVWKSSKDVDHSHFQCQKSAKFDIPTSRDYQLMEKSVPSTLNGPIYTEHLERFTHISVDSTLTKHLDKESLDILFIATLDGTVKKLSYNPVSKKTCLVEILHPFSEGRKIPINSMKLLKSGGINSAIFLATEENVIRLPVQRCSRFRTQRACLNAMDPYCGWNTQTNECTASPNNNPRASYWQQSLLTCPIMSDPIDGDYGSWSTWFQCDYANPDKRVDSNGDYCQCRKRDCNNPAPANGGLPCAGPSLEVTNCTQHGGWTEWSDWSACSQTCDIGTKQRRRSCGNPTPSFGGRVCVGRDVDTQYCTNLPSCNTDVSIISSASLVRESSSKDLWGQWGSWSECSAECGRGFKTRSRKCFSGREECQAGCSVEYEECENKQCSNLVEITDWTPWLKGNSSDIGGSWTEKRFRFSYKAPSQASEIGKIHVEERYCRGTNNCYIQGATQESPQNKWTTWSQCSRECGGGYQMKMTENRVIQRACNTQPCQGEWGCWAQWSSCDGRTLKKHRTRHCQSINGIVNGDRTSPLCSSGTSYQEVSCDGWGAWSDWSQCDLATDSRTRTRECLTNNCDEGHSLERQSCDGFPKQSPSTSSDLLAVACICSFVLGLGIGACVVLYFLKYRKVGGNGSPHYVSAKSQNLYVSLPMLDLKHKHLSSNQSDCGTLRSTSTLRSKAGSSVYNNYETATIKRSHSHRNSSLIAGSSTMMRTDLDSDQLFS